MKLNGKVIVVTGAGSGIGQAVTMALLQRGASVAAVDLSAEGLEATAAKANAGDRLSQHVGNVADAEGAAALPAAVIAHHGAVDGVINCAGIIQPFVPFVELEDAVIRRIVDVNIYGTINMSRAFLPELLKRPEGHYANVASMGGFMPFPKQSMYSASKGAVKLLTEALYAETLETNVGVSVIMPGAVDTNITKNSGVQSTSGGDAEAANRALSAEDAATAIIEGIEAGKLHILVGKDAKMLWRLTRLMPARAIGMVQKMMKKYGL